MKSFILFLSIFFLFGFFAIAQSDSNVFLSMDAKYGKNPALYKGAKYLIDHRVDFGDPFIFSTAFNYGSLSLNGNIYSNLLLNFDVNLNQLVLRYFDYLGAQTDIVLNNNEVDWFYLGDKKFIRNYYDNIKAPFVEQIGVESGLECLIMYSKTFGFDNNNGDAGFGYSKINFDKYIVKDGRAVRFKTKNQFIKNLPEPISAESITYIKQLSQNFRKINGVQLFIICEHINTKIALTK